MRGGRRQEKPHGRHWAKTEARGQTAEGTSPCEFVFILFLIHTKLYEALGHNMLGVLYAICNDERKILGYLPFQTFILSGEHSTLFLTLISK